MKCVLLNTGQVVILHKGSALLHQMLDLRLVNQQQPPITLHNMSPDETVFYSYLYHELSLQKTLSGTQLPVPVFPAFNPQDLHGIGYLWLGFFLSFASFLETLLGVQLVTVAMLFLMQAMLFHCVFLLLFVLTHIFLSLSHLCQRKTDLYPIEVHCTYATTL